MSKDAFTPNLAEFGPVTTAHNFQIGCSLEKKFRISFHTDWKNVQKSINLQGQIRSCRVEVEPKLNKACMHVY